MPCLRATCASSIVSAIAASIVGRRNLKARAATPIAPRNCGTLNFASTTKRLPPKTIIADGMSTNVSAPPPRAIAATTTMRAPTSPMRVAGSTAVRRLQGGPGPPPLVNRQGDEGLERQAGIRPASIAQGSASVRHGCEVLAEQIAAEVAVEVAPHRVDVVAVVLRVVVLDQERRPLDPVVVALAALGRSRPGEGNVLDARLFDLC